MGETIQGPNSGGSTQPPSGKDKPKAKPSSSKVPGSSSKEEFIPKDIAPLASNFFKIHPIIKPLDADPKAKKFISYYSQSLKWIQDKIQDGISGGKGVIVTRSASVPKGNIWKEDFTLVVFPVKEEKGVTIIRVRRDRSEPNHTNVKIRTLFSSGSLIAEGIKVDTTTGKELESIIMTYVLGNTSLLKVRIKSHFENGTEEKRNYIISKEGATKSR